MKSNIIMHSADRELFGVKIRQQTKTGHLNLTDLQAAYEVARCQHGWSQRDAYDVLRTDTNAERLYYLLETQGFIKPGIAGFMKDAEKQGIVAVLKSAKVYVTSGRAANKTTWCNPYVWTLVAMELNPMVYAKTVVWLTDSLLLNRMEAGAMYKGLADQLQRIGFQRPDDFATVARALNFVVFGRHEHGLRQQATAHQLKDLAGLEEKTAWAIEMGMLRNSTDVVASLRNAWRNKFNKGINGSTGS